MKIINFVKPRFFYRKREFNLFSGYSSSKLEKILHKNFNVPNWYIEMLSQEMLSHKQMSALCEMKFIVNHKTGYMIDHEDNVAKLVEQICPLLGFREDATRELKLAAQFHDIGKVVIGHNDLVKLFARDNVLSVEEFNTVIVPHAFFSGEIFKDYPVLADYWRIVRNHHEWWNGRGYPDRLKGKNISYYSRILTILDSYEAMTAERPYQETRTKEKAIDELYNKAGIQFDPFLVPVIAEALRHIKP